MCTTRKSHILFVMHFVFFAQTACSPNHQHFVLAVVHVFCFAAIAVQFVQAFCLSALNLFSPVLWLVMLVCFSLQTSKHIFSPCLQHAHWLWKLAVIICTSIRFTPSCHEACFWMQQERPRHRPTMMCDVSLHFLLLKHRWNPPLCHRHNDSQTVFGTVHCCAMSSLQCTILAKTSSKKANLSALCDFPFSVTRLHGQVCCKSVISHSDPNFCISFSGGSCMLSWHKSCIGVCIDTCLKDLFWQKKGHQCLRVERQHAINALGAEFLDLTFINGWITNMRVRAVVNLTDVFTLQWMVKDWHEKAAKVTTGVKLSNVMFANFQLQFEFSLVPWDIGQIVAHWAKKLSKLQRHAWHRLSSVQHLEHFQCFKNDGAGCQKCNASTNAAGVGMDSIVLAVTRNFSSKHSSASCHCFPRRMHNCQQNDFSGHVASAWCQKSLNSVGMDKSAIDRMSWLSKKKAPFKWQNRASTNPCKVQTRLPSLPMARWWPTLPPLHPIWADNVNIWENIESKSCSGWTEVKDRGPAVNLTPSFVFGVRCLSWAHQAAFQVPELQHLERKPLLAEMQSALVHSYWFHEKPSNSLEFWKIQKSTCGLQTMAQVLVSHCCCPTVSEKNQSSPCHSCTQVCLVQEF